ncbi:MAG: hypothetical protein UX07_C0004G0017 [Parcubacteria group bacterium GW2011_GWA2_45_30]|nr:MAG: hypothetical protein UX07_C0004G0017 [Parcubacteria group bacterium GW2011_GWA2_45_30]
MLSNHLQKVKLWISTNKSDLYIASIIFLTAVASFGLGRLSILWPEKEPIIIENHELGIRNNETAEKTLNSISPNSSFIIPNSSQKYVASKNGAAYHFPWCSGALRIKEENKIWFETKEEAEKAGYKPAGNCEGL